MAISLTVQQRFDGLTVQTLANAKAHIMASARSCQETRLALERTTEMIEKTKQVLRTRQPDRR